MTPAPRTPVLIVIDVQNGFVNDGSVHVIPSVVGLVERWCASAGSVIFTRFHNPPGSPYEELIGWTELRGRPDTDLVAPLTTFLGRPNVHVLDKSTYSSLTDAGRTLLDQLDATDLYLCGIATDACVLKTALDAFEMPRLTPWVVVDACASNATSAPAAEAHEAALLLLRRLIGPQQLVQAREAIDGLTGQRHAPDVRMGIP